MKRLSDDDMSALKAQVDRIKAESDCRVLSDDEMREYWQVAVAMKEEATLRMQESLAFCREQLAKYQRGLN